MLRGLQEVPCVRPRIAGLAKPHAFPIAPLTISTKAAIDRVELDETGDSEEKPDVIKTQLKNGEVPKMLAENWRLVPFESEEGQKFHNAVLDFAKTLFPPAKKKSPTNGSFYFEHDFDAEPVKFMLSKNPDPNAWFVIGSSPPIIVFSEGLFFEKDYKSSSGIRREPPVSSREEFTLTLAHEMTHLKIRARYGDIHNSKIEEGAAYAVPLEIAANRGFNPESSYWLFEKLHQSYPARQRQIDHELFDPHPIAENTRSILDLALAKLRKERGDFTPETPEPPFSENDPIVLAAKTSYHQSYLDARLPKDYQTIPTANKLRALQQILKEIDKPYHARIKDLSDAFRALKGSVKSKEDYTAVHECADEILDFMILHRLHETAKLYSALASLVPHPQPDNIGDLPPLGRLRKLAKACGEFVEAAQNAANQAVKLAADNLIEAANQEKTLQIAGGREFLQRIAWPQFPFPELEEIIAKQEQEEEEDGGDGEEELDFNDSPPKRHSFDDEREEDEMEARYEDDEDEQDGNGQDEEENKPQVRVAWERLYELGQKEPSILRAAFMLGLGKDQNVLDALLRHADLALEILSDDFSKPEKPFPYISQGPSLKTDSIGNIVVDKHGVVTMVATLSAKEARRQFLQLRIDALYRLLVKDFLDAKADPEKEKRTRIFADCLRSYRAALSSSSDSYRHSLICLEVCEKNFPLFLELNHIELLDREYAEEMLRKIIKLLRGGKREGAVACLRIFYGLDQTGSFADVFRESILFGIHGVGESDDYDDDDDEPSNILNNPYVIFLCNQCKGIFTPQEIMQAMEEPSIGYLSATLGELTPELAHKYYIFFKRLADSASVELVPKKLTFEEVCELLQKCPHESGKNQSLKRLMLIFKAVVMTSRKKPSLQQMIDFIEAAGKETINKLQVFVASHRQHITKKAMQLCSEPDLTKSIDQWKTLSSVDMLMPDKVFEILAALVERLEKEDIQIQLQGSEKLLSGERIIEPHLRARLIEIWTDAVCALSGLDDGSPQYFERIKEHSERIKAKVNRIDHLDIFSRLAKTIQAQKELAFFLEGSLGEITKEDIKKAPLAGILADGIIYAIRKTSEARFFTLDYLLTPYSKGFAEKYFYSMEGILKDNYDYSTSFLGDERYFETKSKQSIKLLYENFWAAPLAVRAVIVRELLFDPNESTAEVSGDIFEYAMAKTFPQKGPYFETARDFIRAYLASLPHYMKHLALAAMMTASEKTRGAEGSIGEALAIFAESMGPAETKAGQAASSHPNVPEDIRRDLKRLKFHAAEPYRWEIHHDIEEMRDEIEAKSGQSIQRIGDVLGSGSLYVAVEVEMDNGDRRVLTILRPYALNRAQTGFETMRAMADKLGASHGAFATFQELIERANARLNIETACEIAPFQYDKACNMYEGRSVPSGDERFRFSAPRVTVFGKNFFMMEKMEGVHFSELPDQSDAEKAHKKKVAKAILVLELRHIFQGQFDADRHGGNVKIDGSRIGHFDFKGMALEPWGREGITQFIELLMKVSAQNPSVENFSELLLAEQHALEKQGVAIHPFLPEAQKALLSLGEYIRLFTAEELREIFFEVNAVSHT